MKTDFKRRATLREFGPKTTTTTKKENFVYNVNVLTATIWLH